MSDDTNKVADEASAESEAPVLGEEQTAPLADSAAEGVVAEEVAVVEGENEPTEDDQAESPVDEPEGEAAETETEESAEELAEEDEVEEEDEPDEVEAAEEVVAEEQDDESIKMDWYILMVQSNRERSISDALRRKIAIEGLDEFFGEVVVPVEKVTEFKAGKKKVVERKLYPGYIVVHMHINDDTWFAVRETSGIGDFTGSGGKPTPMLPHEVARIIQKDEEETEDTPKLNIAFNLGDQVKVKEGTFESFEGEVHAIDEHSGRVTVMINIFGRSTPVELEYWQAEQV